MRIRKTWMVLTLGLLAAPLFAVHAQAQTLRNEIEGDIGYYAPSDLKFPNARLRYQSGISWGARYGHRFNEMWGGDVSWSHFDASANRSDKDALQCKTCDFTFEMFDFDLDWYPGGGNWALYGGVGWLTARFQTNAAPPLNFSDNNQNFTWNLGTAYTWMLGSNFYIRPDFRVRFISLHQQASGKYSSENEEFRVGLGWRF